MWRVLLALSIAITSVVPALAAAPLPDPHSSCDSEPTRRSTQGDDKAELTVINNTDSTFELHWLDYEGERVFYQSLPPRSTRPQPTWLTHPWILSDANGTCYLLIVINALQQTMTLGTTTGGEDVSPIASTAAGGTTGTVTTASVAASPTTQVDAESPSGFPTPLVVGALVMLGVLVGVLHVTGRLHLPKGPSRPAE